MVVERDVAVALDVARTVKKFVSYVVTKAVVVPNVVVVLNAVVVL